MFIPVIMNKVYSFSKHLIKVCYVPGSGQLDVGVHPVVREFIILEKEVGRDTKE